LTEGLHQRQTENDQRYRGFVADRVPDFLPSDIKGRCQLIALPQALAQAHYPDNIDLKIKPGTAGFR